MAWIEQRGTRRRVRNRSADGTVGTDSSHPTKAAAELRCKQVDIDQATDTYLDPAAGRITLTQWVDIWKETHIAGPAKTAAYDSHLRIHILPRFGGVPLTQINRHAVKMFVKVLKTRLADSSVTSVMSLLSMLMREAVADRRIGYNPCQAIRTSTGCRPERPHATTAQVNTIVERINRFDDQVLVLATAYTGMRWGELTGLARTNLDLPAGIIHIDPQVGALHEVNGRLTLGPPKTADSARNIHLPAFLTYLLQQVVDSHKHDIVFTGVNGGYLRRSNFARRVWTPAITGNPDRGQMPVIAGMHFHDLRHTHKTWLIEDDIPEIAQAKRLGHTIAGVRGIYSHVTPAMQQRITTVLQQRWDSQQLDDTNQIRHLRAA
jgi:integrase